MAKVGIDFGTTNTSVMYYTTGGKLVSLLRKEEDPSAEPVSFVPTEVYVKRNGTCACGWDISDQVRSKSCEQLIRNLKEKLIDDRYTDTILDYDKWYIFQKFMEYLINNANKSPYLGKGERITEVVLSFPVRNISSLYITKMKECIEAIQYKDYDGNLYSLNVFALQEEPVAISLNYFAMNPENNNVLICDIGGGTTDIAVVSNEDGARRVKEHTGFQKAGNYIDRMLLKHILRKTNVSLEKFESAQNGTLNRTLFTIRSIKEGIEAIDEAPVELIYDKTVIYDDFLDVEEYHLVIDDFVAEIIQECKEMTKKCSVDAIVLAGGGSNCKRIEEMFKKEFSGMPIFCKTVDKRTATASGNAERFKVAIENVHSQNTGKVTIQNMLNHSYGTDCFDEEGKKLLRIFFHKNEILPIEERKVGFLTRDTTTSVKFNFYLGDDTDKNTVREFDLRKYDLLAGKDFLYHFGKKVPKGTKMEVFFSMNENYIMQIRVASKHAVVKEQVKVLTGLD